MMKHEAYENLPVKNENDNLIRKADSLGYIFAIKQFINHKIDSLKDSLSNILYSLYY